MQLSLVEEVDVMMSSSMRGAKILWAGACLCAWVQTPMGLYRIILGESNMGSRGFSMGAMMSPQTMRWWQNASGHSSKRISSSASPKECCRGTEVRSSSASGGWAWRRQNRGRHFGHKQSAEERLSALDRVCLSFRVAGRGYAYTWASRVKM